MTQEFEGGAMSNWVGDDMRKVHVVLVLRR